MLRAITPGDRPAVVRLAVSSGLFTASDVNVVTKMMSDYFADKRDEGHVCVLDENEGPVGVVYYQPAVAADRTWYLTMIAVHAEQQGRGRGAAMMRHVEDDLRARHQRLLLVETSGVAEFARTRAFYDQCGYEREARIRDYYGPGDDMILFRKALTAQ